MGLNYKTRKIRCVEIEEVDSVEVEKLFQREELTIIMALLWTELFPSRFIYKSPNPQYLKMSVFGERDFKEVLIIK